MSSVSDFGHSDIHVAYGSVCAFTGKVMCVSAAKFQWCLHGLILHLLTEHSVSVYYMLGTVPTSCER